MSRCKVRILLRVVRYHESRCTQDSRFSLTCQWILDPVSRCISSRLCFASRCSQEEELRHRRIVALNVEEGSQVADPHEPVREVGIPDFVYLNQELAIRE